MTAAKDQGPDVVSAGETRWRSDGWDASVRIGVLVPHNDLGPESELQAMAPAGVMIHAARVPFGAMAAQDPMASRGDPTTTLAAARAFAEPPFLDDAAELLAAAPLDAIAYGFVSSAYVTGVEGEAEMVARLERRTRGIPVVATTTAIVEGLHALAAKAIALVSPPWFNAEVNELGPRYYESAGFEVVYAAPCDLPSDQAKITPANLYEWVSKHAPAGIDAIVLGGSGFRSVSIIAALEEDLGHPVVTANQALLWSALRAAGADPRSVKGYGRLFGHK